MQADIIGHLEFDIGIIVTYSKVLYPKSILTFTTLYLYSFKIDRQKNIESNMQTDLAQDAISAALQGNWNKATETNIQILKGEPDNTEALLRLGRAYSELGKFDQARKTLQKLLKIDPFNNIATRLLDKWKGLKNGAGYASHPSTPQSFLEEPGKTKIVSLRNLGNTSVLVKLDAADEVKLSTHSHRAVVTTLDNKYVGRLPDDLSARLKKLVGMGNVYQVYIKSIDKNEVKVFIRETVRDKKLSDVPSFSPERFDYVSFTPPELVHKKEIISREEDSEE